MGVKLLDRLSSGVRPTAYGEALLRGSLNVFDDLKQSLRELEFIADASVGEISIGTTEPGASGFVPLVIDEFMQRWPRINVHVVTANPDLLADRELRGRTIELAIGAIPAIGPGSDFELTPLFDDNHVVVAGAASKWARRRKLELGELAEEPWVLPPSDSPGGRLALEAFRCAGMELPASRVLTLSIPLAHHLVATGRYVSMMPNVMTRLSGHMHFKSLPVAFPAMRRPISIMTHRGRTLSPLAARFVAVANSVARQARGDGAG